MDPRTFQYIAAACAGELRGGRPAQTVSRVTTDSRQLGAGDLFVALRGERYDGHQFLAEAAARGAGGALIERTRVTLVPENLPVIVVDDSRRALGECAAFYRRDFNLPIVGIGGSNGKTTTKELVAGAVSSLGPTLRSEASFNNDVGVPATLLRLEARYRVAVLEVGTNHPGELKPLVRMIAPRIGVITSIGREHLEFFDSLSGVAQEEGGLADELPPADSGGVLVLNGDNPFADDLARRTRARVVRVGFGSGNDWRAEVGAMDWSGTTFLVQAPKTDWNGEYATLLLGRHSVPNAMLALAVACELGVESPAAREGLANIPAAPHRLNVRAAGGVQLLDDSYNANADSVLAALHTISDLPCAGRRVAVLGDMAELGPHAETAHAEVGTAAARLGIDAVFAVGRYAAVTAKAAGSNCGRAFIQIAEAAPAVLRFLQPDDAVLIKASRASRLERLVELLLRQLELREQAHSCGPL